MQFPLKPFLDRVIVEVIPIEQYFKKPEGVEVLLDREFSQRSDRGIVKAVGDGVTSAGVFLEMPVQVEDEVQFDPDTAYAGLIYLNPGDKLNADAPKYLEIRVGDLLGRTLRVTERLESEVLQ